MYVPFIGRLYVMLNAQLVIECAVNSTYMNCACGTYVYSKCGTPQYFVTMSIILLVTASFSTCSVHQFSPVECAVR